MTVQGVSCDIFIASDKSRNRALDGDMVALRLVNMANWKEVSASSGGAASTEGSSSASGKDGDDQAATKAAEDVNNLWRPRVPESWDFSSSAAAKRGGSGEAKSSVSVSAANRSGPSWKQVREGIAAGLQPQAEVVSILDRKSSPNVICVMDTLCRAEKLTPGKALPSGENFVRLKPVDNRFPYMLLPRHKAPKDFVADPLGSPSRLKLFVVRPHVEEWRESSRFAKCSIVRQLGEAGEISAETEALLMQHGFARRGTDGDFDQDVLDCLESFRISYATAGGGAGPEDAAGAEANSTTTTTAMAGGSTDAPSGTPAGSKGSGAATGTGGTGASEDDDAAPEDSGSSAVVLVAVIIACCVLCMFCVIVVLVRSRNKGPTIQQRPVAPEGIAMANLSSTIEHPTYVPCALVLPFVHAGTKAFV